jgi:hypothetical protein
VIKTGVEVMVAQGKQKSTDQRKHHDSRSVPMYIPGKQHDGYAK